jgi:hypothetical protein
MPDPLPHPQRKEIARYVLARGSEWVEEPPSPPERLPPIKWPAGLAPTPVPPAVTPNETDPLPEVDVVVITWTVDEADALASVFMIGAVVLLAASVLIEHGRMPNRW